MSVRFLSVFSVFSVRVFCLFLSVFFFCVCSPCVFSACVFCLCFLSVCVVSVLSGFAFYRAAKNDTFLSINIDIILLWSGLAHKLLVGEINAIKGW